MAGRRSQPKSSPISSSVDGRRLLKSAHVIMAKERGSLELLDRKIFNFLLSRTISRNQDPSDNIHSVFVSDILKFIGHTSTDRLNQSMARLASVNILIDYVDNRGSKHSVLSHYLSYDLEHSETGQISFAFDKILMRFLANPKVFAILDLATVRGFRSDYAARLYEIMTLQFGKRHPEWTATIDEFREIMAVGQNYPRYNNLRARVIDPAVNEVNAAAPFSVIMTEKRGGRGGKVIGLTFRAGAKNAVSLSTVGDVARHGIMAKRRKNPERDPLTIDLLSRKTDAEKGPFDLSEETIRRSLEDYNIPEISAPYEEWKRSYDNRQPPIDPDWAFLTWLDVYTERNGAQKDDILAQGDPDIISNILETIGCTDEDD